MENVPQMPLSNRREGTAFKLFLVITLVVMPVYLYYGYANRPVTATSSMLGDLEIRATSVQLTSLALGGPDLSLTAVIYNPNGFGVSLNGANYSIYDDGHYLQSGQITREYALAPESTQTVVFPVTVGWKSALQAFGDYLWGWGDVNWEVKGSASIGVGGILLTVPFDLAIRTT
jgi:LEA14-like dessication related protein